MIIKFTNFIVGVKSNEDVDDFLSKLDDLLNTWDENEEIASCYDYTVDDM
uniref:Uncharacterized protein n=1 Tax=viral metagenome TaxID=1070528 RepID=A0A6M3MCP0_9ZZZZ